MASFGGYLVDSVLEGLVIGFVFWLILLITVEGTSLWAAVRAAVVAEFIGNLPYLAGMSAIDPPTILTTLIGAVVFVRLILRVGELTAFKASYGVLMTYFVIAALYTCNAAA